MLQLAAVFTGDMSKREGWGWHDIDSWKAYFETLSKIGQIKKVVDVNDVVTNALVGPANTFDKAKVRADAAGYALTDDMKAVDLEKIKANFFANVVK